MEEINFDLLEVYDLDWFFLVQGQWICHASSGGGLIPDSTYISKEDFHKVRAYFRGLPNIASSYMGPNGDKSEVVADDVASNPGFAHVLFALKGLWTFDIETPMRNDASYQLKACPVTPLTLSSVPEEIQEILKRTHLDVPIEELKAFQVTDFPA